MSAPIELDDDQLNDLMAELEAETGVSAVAPAPATAAATPAAPALTEEELMLDELTVTEPELPVAEPTAPAAADTTMFSADELAEMQELEEIGSGAKPKMDMNALQAALAAKKAQPADVVLAEDPIPGISPDDLESELAALTDEAATEPQPVAESAPVAEPAATVEAVSAVMTATTKAVIAEHAAPAPIPTAAPTGKLNFYIDPNTFKEETSIRQHNLDTCFMEQSSLRAYYGSMAANAEAQAARAKTKFEVLEARLYDHHRKILVDSGVKATEKMVENAVKTDPRWLEGKERVIDADTIASVNKALAISLADRRDMLIQLGADRRDESKGQARLLAIKEEQENLRQNASTAAANALRK